MACSSSCSRHSTSFAWMFYQRANAPKHLVYLLIGLVLTFLSLAGRFSSTATTSRSSGQRRCVVWFSQRTGIRLVERGSMLVVAHAHQLDAGPGEALRSTAHKACPVLEQKHGSRAWPAAIALYLYGRCACFLTADRDVLPGLSPKSPPNAATVLCAATQPMGELHRIGHQLGFVLGANVVVMALSAYSLAVFSGMLHRPQG